MFGIGDLRRATGPSPALTFSETGCHVDSRSHVSSALHSTRVAVTTVQLSSPLHPHHNLLSSTPGVSLLIPFTSPPRASERKEARMRKGVCDWPLRGPERWKTQAGATPGPGREAASPPRPAGASVRLLLRARMTDGPQRGGHCLQGSCVLGGGGRGGAPSERSLGPRLAFGSLNLDSNRPLFWLLRMGRFGS